jgi:hypothetical protein
MSDWRKESDICGSGDLRFVRFCSFWGDLQGLEFFKACGRAQCLRFKHLTFKAMTARRDSKAEVCALVLFSSKNEYKRKIK